MIAQKRLVRVTLDITCYDDLDVENMNWKELLELEGDEDVYASTKEIEPCLYFFFFIMSGFAARRSDRDTPAVFAIPEKVSPFFTVYLIAVSPN